VNQETLRQIVRELSELLPGRFFGRIFQLSPLSLAIDFGIRDHGYLFISVEPADPRMYLIKRRTRDLEKASKPLASFAQSLRATFGGGSLTSITMDENDRIVRFSFALVNELGNSQVAVLVVQLTGRAANLFILDEDGTIKHAFRNPQGEGQQLHQLYRPPPLQTRDTQPKNQPSFADTGGLSISETVDNYYLGVAAEVEFEQLATSVLAVVRKEITRRRKLQDNLKKDLANQGNPDDHKRLGDLLLANISTATRSGNTLQVTDYFADNTPLIELELDEKTTLQDAAAESFSRYSKAKRGLEEINSRLSQVGEELAKLTERQTIIEAAITKRDIDTLRSFTAPAVAPKPAGKKQKASPALTGLRRYLSSDGYEVIVGRSARDNDRLTFGVARPNDLWLHAGDYPGSHVIVRNSSRDEIPQRTILEAAQLAAKFSQAGNDSKVNIHYTRRKFLSKPKGAAAGLVRMTNFKTVTVAPGENLKRL
jgi:predicted ribosome quality control (RQC) complex YloA/Tae2 family protein